MTTDTKTTRRALIAGLATVAAAAPALAAGTPSIGPNDARMLAAEAEHHAIYQHTLTIPDQDEIDALIEPHFRRMAELEAEIFSLPADDYVGLACKARMVIWGDDNALCADAYQNPPQNLEDHGRSTLHLDLQRLAARASA